MVMVVCGDGDSNGILQDGDSGRGSGWGARHHGSKVKLGEWQVTIKKKMEKRRQRKSEKKNEKKVFVRQETGKDHRHISQLCISLFFIPFA